MNNTEIVNVIIEAINTIFSNIFSSIDNNIYTNLDNLVFVNSDLINTSNLFKLFNSKYSFVYLADSMLVGICLFYIVRFYYSNYVQSNVERPSQFIFKLIIFAFIINFSFFIIEQFINLNYLISSAFQEIGNNILGKEICFSNLIELINNKVEITNDSFSVFSINGIIKSFLTFGLLTLLLSYSLRYILLQVLLLFTPFAFLSLINLSTSWIFQSWFKALFSLLLIQSFVAIVLIVVFCINDNLLFIGGIYALYRINSYVRELFGGVSLDVSGNINGLMSIIKK